MGVFRVDRIHLLRTCIIVYSISLRSCFIHLDCSRFHFSFNRLFVSPHHQADPFEGKINVGVGAYRDDNGKPWVLPSVAEAERRIVDAKLDMEYPPIDGVPEFVKQATYLAYGKDSEAVKSGRIAACQSLSGTGALRLASGYLARFRPSSGGAPSIMVPNPTWGNHYPIFEHMGHKVETYRYWDQKTLGLDLKGLLEDLKAKPNGQIVLLHSCAHNPTGVDPTLDQWKEISKVCKDKQHFVIFDNAYQGFASGDANKDVAAVRLFVEEGHNIGLCQSFAKNFGLYGQRIGQFSIVCSDAGEAARVLSQIKIVARAIYSNPPLHGARIVAGVLADEKLHKQWLNEIALMAGRIGQMRTLLRDSIVGAGSKKNWDHITNQIGMFSYTGLTKEQCDVMTAKHHVYLTSNGRISMAGVTSKNVGRLAEAIHDVSK